MQDWKFDPFGVPLVKGEVFFIYQPFKLAHKEGKYHTFTMFSLVRFVNRITWQENLNICLVGRYGTLVPVSGHEFCRMLSCFGRVRPMVT